MKIKARSGLLVALLVSALFLLCFTQPVSAVEASGIAINADGTVQGTSGIQRSGDLYTVTMDLAGPLRVERDDIVIDGAGHTIVGAQGRGVVLAGRHGVTLRNAYVTLEGGYVIDVENANDCTISGNTLEGTPKPVPGLPAPPTLIGPIGINFLHSQGITVRDNIIRNFSYALSLDWSSGHTITSNIFIDGIVGIDLTNTTGCLFRNNQLMNSGFGIQLYDTYRYDNDLDASNTIDGKPICYWLNHKGETIPQNAAYVVLVNCANMTVERISPRGIALVSTTSSVISKVKMTGRSDGISMQDCSGISIVDSILRDQATVCLGNSNNNVICNNDISNHSYRGLDTGSGYNNLVSGNTFIGNGYAVAPFREGAPGGNVIVSNNFTENDFALIIAGNAKVSNNIFENNNQALLFGGGSSSTVTKNAFLKNKIALAFSASSGNKIYLNNFVDNDRDVSDTGTSNQSSTQSTSSHSGSSAPLILTRVQVREVNFIPPPPPSTNIYDNGTSGNYWNRYTGLDENGDGIGDTAYLLYENNEDRFPLMKPVSLADLPAPPDEQFLPSNGTSPVQEPTGTDSSGTQTEPDQFSWLPVAAVSVAAAAVVAIVAAVYLKKRKSETLYPPK